MTTTTNAGAGLTEQVLRAVLHLAGRPEPSAREVQAVGVVAAGGVRRDGRKGWLVRSQSGDREYRVGGGSCPCPDDRSPCKHLLAVDLYQGYARELARRLDRGEWDGSDEDAAALHAEYADLLRAAAGYTPPPDGLLTSFRLEAVGDDAWRRKRAAARNGRPYVPSKVRDVSPDRPWVAAINGLSARYEFDRGFLRGDPDYREADKYGARGVYLYYRLPPGLYEVYERLGHYKSRRYFARVADLRLAEVTKLEVLEWLAGRRS